MTQVDHILRKESRSRYEDPCDRRSSITEWNSVLILSYLQLSKQRVRTEQRILWWEQRSPKRNTL